MRLISPSTVLCIVMSSGLVGGALLAQDQNQPPAGATPPAAGSQTSPEAQPHRAPNPHRQAKMMAKKLGLSADQQTQLEPILADREQQMQGVRADTTLAPNDRREKARGIMQDSDSKIDAILTDPQKQQYEQMKQSHRAARQQGQSPAAAPSN